MVKNLRSCSVRYTVIVQNINANDVDIIEEDDAEITPAWMIAAMANAPVGMYA